MFKRSYSNVYSVIHIIIVFYFEITHTVCNKKHKISWEIMKNCKLKTS